MLLECVVLCVKVLDGVALPLKSVKLFAFFWLPALRDVALPLNSFEGWSTLLRGEACRRKTDFLPTRL